MSSKVKVLVFAGSARKESFNKKLAIVAADIVRQAGADISYVDLGDLDIPLYNGDLESASGIPEGAKRLRELFRQHDALIIASPEYNHSFSPLLKNAIDWVSRQSGDENYHTFFGQKIALLLSASPGNSGGARGLPHLQQVLSHLSVDVLEESFSLPRHQEAFSEQGTLLDGEKSRQLEQLVATLIEKVAAKNLQPA
jgi:chromate reductase